MAMGSFSVTTAELAALSHYGIVPAYVSELIKSSLRLWGKALQVLLCGSHLCFLSPRVFLISGVKFSFL